MEAEVFPVRSVPERSTSNVETEMNEEMGEDFSGTLPGMELDEDHAAFLTVLAMVLLVVFVITFVITVIFITFVGNPVAVGGKRFFMESRAFMKSAGVGRVFWAFGEGRYLNVVKTMFLRALFVNLWSLPADHTWHYQSIPVLYGSLYSLGKSGYEL